MNTAHETDLFEFFHCFIPLINSHSNDFIINDLWNNFLPEKIRHLIDSIDNPNYILDQYIKCCNRVPVYNNLIVNTNFNWSSLIDTKEKIIDRNIRPNWEIVSNDLDAFIQNCANFSSFKTFINEKENFFDDIFIDYGMNEKKSYEVEKMSCLCRSICKKHNIDSVVDVGSGKGYLGSDLSISNGLNVIELDSRESNEAGALSRRKRFILQVPSKKRKLNATENLKMGSCRSIARNITSTDTISKILLEEGFSNTEYLMTGLHSCGGLSSTMLRNFVNCKDAKAIVLVGCCYHLLNEKFVNNFPNDQFEMSDFPLSNKFQKSGIVLGRNAKTFSSQTVKRVLRDGNLHPTMFHRILLQKLLHDKLGYVSDNLIVGKIGKQIKDENNFEEYVRISCRKLGFVDLIENMTSEEIKEYEIKYSDLKFRFTNFFYLKCCMSAIVENLIIWDRLIYLVENGIDAQVLELFDELRSPRRYAIVAIK